MMTKTKFNALSTEDKQAAITNGEYVMPVAPAPAPSAGKAVSGLSMDVVNNSFFESFSSILNSPDARGVQLNLGEAISFDGDDPWAVAYGSFAVAINDFGKIRNKAGMSLGKWIIANTPEGEDAHLPEKLKITKVIPTSRYKMTAYVGYEKLKDGYEAANNDTDAIRVVSDAIRLTGLLEEAKEKPGYSVPTRFYQVKAEADW